VSDDLISVVGGQLLVDHQITPPTGTAITGAALTVFDRTGAKPLGLDGAVMTVTTGDGDNGYDDGAYGVSYAITTDDLEPGNYTYLVLPNTGQPIRGVLTLWPQWSALDAYIQQVQDLLQDTEAGEDQRFLSLRDYQRSLAAAGVAYAKDRDAITLDHETDELAATGYAEPFCLWAAGWCMAFPLANKAAQTNEPQVEAGVVSYKTIRDQRYAQGMAMMKQAAGQWGESGVLTGTLTVDSLGPQAQYEADLVYGL
jgi:hypothetical protein